MESTRAFGARIESLAELQFSGDRWKTVQRNYRCRCGEIDLILEESLPDSGVELVFVEVRARREGNWVSGVESVDWLKRRKIERTAACFLMKYHGPARAIRFDVLDWDGKKWTHLENAWLAYD